MAAAKGSDEYSAVIDSDEYHANYCSPCARDGTQNGAATYCMECEEYLCTSCLASHNRLAKLRAHTLVNQSSEQQTFKTAPVLTEKCDKHVGRLLDTFCRAHDVVCCSTCVSLDHKLCKMQYIPDVAHGNQTSEELQSMLLSIRLLQKDVDSMRKEKQQELASLEEEVADAKARCHEKKERLQNLLNEMEERTIGDIEARHENCKQRLERDTQKLETLRTAIDNRLGRAASVTDNAEAFVLVKKGREDGINGTVLLSEIQSVAPQTIRFQTTTGPEELLACYTTLGTVDERPVAQAEDLTYMAVTNKTARISYRQDRANTCSVMGCCQMADSSILLADWDNNSIKRLDSKHKLVEVLQMPDSPSDVCAIGARVAAVSLQWLKQIHLISVGASMTWIKHFDISEPCRGIAYHDNRLYLTCGGGSGGGGRCKEGPGQVQVVNIAGTLLNTFQTDSRSAPLFKTPYNVAVNGITRQIHVCDCANGLITLDSNGNKVWTFTDSGLNFANGVCTDELGQVFVCGFRSGNVFLLTRNGRKLCKLIKEGTDIAKVKSLIYDHVRSQLVVGLQERDKIWVYDLKK